jgi:hypothetical protein
MTHFPQSRFIADLVSLKGCRKWERLKKNWSRAAARNFGDWRGLSEGTCPQRPVTERKRSQNPKEPLLSFSHPHDYSFSENALAKDNIPGQRSSITPRPGGALEPVLKFKPAYPWLKTVKASHGFFAQKKFANFFQGFYAKSFGNRVKTTLKTMQICPQNHAGYEMSSIYQQKSKILRLFMPASASSLFPSCRADLSAIARRATAEAFGRRRVTSPHSPPPASPCACLDMQALPLHFLLKR